MRISKEPAVRREELMDVAERLFKEKGVDATSVNDIVKNTGVAKGTFYWYFTSKEALLDALAERECLQFVNSIQPIVTNNELNALDKLRLILEAHGAIGPDRDAIVAYMHQAENTLAHQKRLLEEIRLLTPIIGPIIEQGVRENLFRTNHPHAVAEFMLLSLSFQLNPSTVRVDLDQQLERLHGLQDIIERALGAETDSLSFLKALVATEEN